MRRTWRAMVFLGTVALIAGLVSAAPASADDSRTVLAAPVTLRVGTFNIEYGGTVVDFGQVVAAVEASGADVLGIEEAEGHIPRLARALGWPYYDVRTQVISKYPLIDPSGGGGRYLFVEVTPGRVVAIENVHLPSAPYGPNRVLRGATRAEILALERKVRLPAVRPFLRASKTILADDVPVFLVGDFNAPSHLDWTSRAVGSRRQVVYPVRWPVSVAVERTGFRDAFRAVYPNEVRRPGLTWWAARPRVDDSWNPPRTAPQDRIDQVYAAGAKPTGVTIIGEPGGPGVDVPVRPWPSDHRAVVGTFEVRAALPPAYVAVDRRLVSVGATAAVRFHAPAAGAHVVVVPLGAPLGAAVVDLPTGSVPDGTLAVETAALTPGGYRVVLLDAADAVLARTSFWVKVRGDGPGIATGKSTYAVGEPIDVTWSNAPGNRWDWVGIYRRGADPLTAWYLLWSYTDTQVAGSVVLDGTGYGKWPLKAGAYSVYLLRDDGYRLLAAADFDIA
jgi:endonuclease/exonuclease/phosphatase family metal-dependent hydrolase